SRAAQLLYRLADMRQADDITLGQVPAVRIDRDRAVEPDRPAFDEASAFAAFAEAVILELHDHQRREVVVDQGDVDVLGTEPRRLVEALRHRSRAGRREGLLRLVEPEEGPAPVAISDLRRALDEDRALPKVGRALGVRDDESQGAVGLETEVEP